jgi:phosphotransferase system enzyme I (PtsI)
LNQEKAFIGKTGYPGFALAKALVLHERKFDIPQHKISDVSLELKKWHSALLDSQNEIKELISQNKDSEAQDILEAHLLMLEDPEWVSGIENRIQNGFNAIQSVDETSTEFKALLESLNDPYMKARAQDIADLNQRVLSHLVGSNKSDSSLSPHDEFVVIAKDLLPSQFLSLDRKNLRALLIENSSQTSHTVILAKTFEIPLILASPSLSPFVKEGDLIAVNALKAEIILQPSLKTQEQFIQLLEEQKKQKQDQTKWIHRKSISLDGTHFEVASNLSSLTDAEIAMTKGSEGCGLFRSEFLLMQRNHWPTEDEQFEVYSQLVKMMKPHRTVLRLFDVGGDKSLPYFKLPKEENPFLGLRGYRLLQKHPQLLKDQIRAALRASLMGPLSLMAPMITTPEEVYDFKKTVDECLQELKIQNKLNSQPQLEIGIMVEVPAIVMALPDIANDIDFISVGTNDLIQYLCATDRMNSEVAPLHDAYSPSVLKFLNFMASQVKPQIESRKLWMGMCGELAGLDTYVPLLMAIGFKELSVSPGALLKTRQVICETDLKKAKSQLELCLKAKNSRQLRSLLENQAK